MPYVTDCADCGSPVSFLWVEDIHDPFTGAWNAIYLCRECADRREGIPPMDEQCMDGDGTGRR